MIKLHDMEGLEIFVLSAIVLLLVINLGTNLLRRREDHASNFDALMQSMHSNKANLEATIRSEMSTNRKELHLHAKDGRSELGVALDKFATQQRGVFELVNRQVSQLVQSNEQRFQRMQDMTVQSLEKVRSDMEFKLSAIQTDHRTHMEKMRETVDEKLHKTLEERLGRSFQLVSDHLEKVQQGLGEMKHLAAGVGDLKKVLSNVKTRGILGEIQLLNIIEEILTSEQYELNVSTVPGRECRVEVAIKMPGKDPAQTNLYLPIDSKFPMDRYQQLCDAYEQACPLAIQEAKKMLHRALLTSAKDIQAKYISPPYTTDFAILFLPVEGLYAEISRSPQLLHRLRTEFQILVVGPSNLSAFLSSLQMGFRTLAIERRSSEVWTLLSQIKTEFGKFGMALDKVQKKLTEANNVIEQAGTRRRVLERKLNKVEELPNGLGFQADERAGLDAPGQKASAFDDHQSVNRTDRNQLAIGAIV